MFLLDTNIITELRKANTGKAHANVLSWVRSAESNFLYISVISILELEQGALQLQRRDPSQGERLLAWIETQVIPGFEGRILPIELPQVKACAKLNAAALHSGREALIAATALSHSMIVVTRNVADFESTGVKILNPWL